MMLKAELHCHLEGAADPGLALRLAKRHGIDLTGVVRDGRYVWDDFTSFLSCYDKASSVFRTPEDYRLLTADVLARLAEQEAIYAELIVSPDHAAQVGIDYETLIEAIDSGMADAERDSGIVARICLTCVRHLGPDKAEAVARQAQRSPHPRVTGYGMAGDERKFAVEDFADAFSIAAEAGLGLTAHAGEFAGADSVLDVLDHLQVSRVGHGVRSVEDPELVERLADEGLVLEICPGSNIALGVFGSAADHPLRDLIDAGVPVCLNSDDPPYFDTTLAAEYASAQSVHGLTGEELLDCTRTALKAAFVDEPTRKTLLAKL